MTNICRRLSLSLSLLVAGVFFSSSRQCGAAEPATQPAAIWDKRLFAYERPARVIVEETTPTDAQVAFFVRPPAVDEKTPEPKATGPAEPRVINNINVVHLLFRDATGDLVPALLCTPTGKPGPFPVVIATHGLASNKMQVCGQVAPALTQHGYAVLAADLPCHGERPGNPFEMVKADGGMKLFQLYRKAVVDNHQLMDIAEQLPELDTKKGFVLVGYSLGSWMSSIAGPSDDRVKAMVLMVGGAYDIPADILKIPEAAACDPRNGVAHFAGKPLLLQNGRTDVIVVEELSRRLFAACAEPKKQLWYDSGHLLPRQAYEDAAIWIDQQNASPK
jgi:dienelactone hydrolase